MTSTAFATMAQEMSPEILNPYYYFSPFNPRVQALAAKVAEYRDNFTFDGGADDLIDNFNLYEVIRPLCFTDTQAQVITTAEILKIVCYEDMEMEFFGAGSLVAWNDEINAKGEYIGGQYYLAWGCPDFWIDTIKGTANGRNWSESYVYPFDKYTAERLKDFFKMLYNC